MPLKAGTGDSLEQESSQNESRTAISGLDHQAKSDDIYIEGDALVESRGQLWRSLARVALVFASIVGLSMYFHVAKTLAVVLALILMIMIHELGHFATAKWSGMKVTEYFLGFGPKLWSFKRGETEYGVKILPAGGYVRIVGMTNLETVDPTDESKAYRNATFPRKVLVSSAGSIMHFVMAYLILVILFSVVGVANPAKAQIASLVQFSKGMAPAAIAGLQPGDIIQSVNGTPIGSIDNLVTQIQDSAGKILVLGIQRGDINVTKSVQPVEALALESGVSGSAGTLGLIGVRLTEPVQTVGVLTSFVRPFSVIGSYSAATVTALVSHFSPSGITQYVKALSHPASTTSGAGADVRFESPVGIVRLASQAANVGLGAVLTLLFSINVFIGIFNMAPLLPLDGGHVVIATYERIRSRRGRPFHADMMKLIPVTYAVLFIIVLLGVTALYLDITHPLANPFG